MKISCNMVAMDTIWIDAWSVSDPEAFLRCVEKQIAAAKAIWPDDLDSLKLDIGGKFVFAKSASKSKGKKHATDHD